MATNCVVYYTVHYNSFRVQWVWLATQLFFWLIITKNKEERVSAGIMKRMEESLVAKLTSSKTNVR